MQCLADLSTSSPGWLACRGMCVCANNRPTVFLQMLPMLKGNWRPAGCKVSPAGLKSLSPEVILGAGVEADAFLHLGCWLYAAGDAAWQLPLLQRQ